MNNLDAILDLGSQSLRLGVFDQDSKIFIFLNKKILMILITQVLKNH